MKNIVIIILVILGGCMRYEHTGNMAILSQDKLSQLKKGTTKQEIIQLLGTPESESYASERNILTYRFKEKEVIPYWFSVDINTATSTLMLTLKDGAIDDVYYDKTGDFKYINNAKQNSK